MPSGLSDQSRGTEDAWQEASLRTTVRAENEVEAHKLVNNYMVNKAPFHFGCLQEPPAASPVSQVHFSAVINGDVTLRAACLNLH